MHSSSTALVYATYDGIANNYTGCALQTKYFLHALHNERAAIESAEGPIDVYVAVADPDHECPGYWVDPEVLDDSAALVEACDGVLWPLPHGDEPLWTMAKWQQMTAGLADRIAGLVHDYDRVVVIAVDAPYTELAGHLDQVLSPGQWAGVVVVHAMYSSTALPGNGQVDGRCSIERACFERARSDPHVWLADIGDYFTEHLIRHAGAAPEAFLAFTQCTYLKFPRLTPPARETALAQLEDFGIPTDRPIVTSFGRADPIKGISRAIAAIAPLGDEVHFVLIAVPYSPTDPVLEQYQGELDDSGLRYTYVTGFQRELPRSLCSIEQTFAVILSSIGEPVGQVPQDVAMWARGGGPVIVAPHEGGLVGQISDGVSGFYYEQGSLESMTGALRRALVLGLHERRAMNKAALDAVVARNDYVASLIELLDNALAHAEPPVCVTHPFETTRRWAQHPKLI